MRIKTLDWTLQFIVANVWYWKPFRNTNADWDWDSFTTYSTRIVWLCFILDFERPMQSLNRSYKTTPTTEGEG